MAKKNENLESRVLRKTIGATAVTLDGDGDITLNGAEGWKSVLVDGGAQWLIYHIGYFDLSGYTLQDKTLFPQGVLLQDMCAAPTGVGLLATAPGLSRCTIVSTTPINEADLSIVSTGLWSPPGSMLSTHSLENILVGRIQYYATLTTLTGFQQLKESTWGAGDSTAADKLYFCDAYQVPKVSNTGFNIPDQAFVIPSTIFEEPDLEYMMRLSRSLEPVY